MGQQQIEYSALNGQDRADFNEGFHDGLAGSVADPADGMYYAAGHAEGATKRANGYRVGVSHTGRVIYHAALSTNEGGR